MKKILLAYLIGTTFLTTNVSCQNAAKSPAKAPVQNEVKTTVAPITDLSTADFSKKLSADNSAMLLDVRTPQEYANGHLPNAATINFFDADFKERANKLDKTKAIYVYCAVGGRSAKASKILQELGFKAVYNLLGGFNGWAAAKLPTVK
jgi:phage shock protein E